MNTTEFIWQSAGHSLWEGIEDVKGVCCFCGKQIKQGKKIKDCVSSIFGNWDLFKYSHLEWCCPACVYCLRESKLRTSNWIATGEKLIYFKRENIAETIFNPPNPPFVIAITESFKKHLAIKARINYSQKRFWITMENMGMWFEPDKWRGIFEIMKELAEGEFSKTEIRSGEYQARRIQNYGIEKWEKQEELLKPVRRQPVFKLLVFAINLPKKEVKKDGRTEGN